MAESQYGVVSRDQLRRLGLSEATIDYAIASGRLYPIFRGAFGLGHGGVGRHGRLLAATLACGDGSVISHGTAAALLGFWDRYPTSIDVIAPVQAGRKIQGVRRRHTPQPLPDETKMARAVPCTSPSRTIVDVAGMVREPALRRTIEQAAVHGMFNVPEIDAILAGPRRRGSKVLRSILAEWRRYPPAMQLRSVMEARMLPLLSRHSLPAPQCNETLTMGGNRLEVDFLWPDRRFVVETDGAKYHDNPEARDRDRRRDEILRANGYRIWRLRWADLARRPEATMATLSRQLKRG